VPPPQVVLGDTVRPQSASSPVADGKLTDGASESEADPAALTARRGRRPVA
jgi:hypothetical protein